MVTKRHKRTLVWLMVLGGLAGLWFIPMGDRVSGSFQVGGIRDTGASSSRGPSIRFMPGNYDDEAGGALVASITKGQWARLKIDSSDPSFSQGFVTVERYLGRGAHRGWRRVK